MLIINFVDFFVLAIISWMGWRRSLDGLFIFFKSFLFLCHNEVQVLINGSFLCVWWGGELVTVPSASDSVMPSCFIGLWTWTVCLFLSFHHKAFFFLVFPRYTSQQCFLWNCSLLMSFPFDGPDLTHSQDSLPRARNCLQESSIYIPPLLGFLYMPFSFGNIF